VRRRLHVYGCIISLLLPLLVGCGPKRDMEATYHIRLYRILPVARESQLTENEGEGEAIALINAGDKPHTLSGWTITTNAGRLTLPKLTMDPGEILYLANNATYFQAYWHFSPDFEYGVDAELEVPDLKVPEGAVPLLNDHGDEVRLLDDQGNVVDILAYGEISNPSPPWSGPPVQLVESPAVPRENQVLTRRWSGGVLRLEASAAAWTGENPADPVRVYYPGQSDLPISQVHGTATFIPAPEDPREFMAELLKQARNTIRLAGYQFSSWELAEHLVDAVQRGVRVQVAVERNPGGGDLSAADRALHQWLTAHGVEILYAYAWDGPGSSRYSVIHSNYVLIDNDAVIISSAPWTDEAFGSPPICGSRQWVAGIAGSAEMADMFRKVWSADFGRLTPDVRPFSREEDGVSTDTRIRPRGEEVTSSDRCQGSDSTEERGVVKRIRGTATVTRLLSPDNSLDRDNGLLGIVRQAREELLVSGLYIDLWWGNQDRPNPYLTEIVEAARRGVSVRVLLDPEVTSPDDPKGNQQVVAYLNDLAWREGLDLEARLVNREEAGIGGRYQAIGMVVDDSVVIGSMNGSENSFRRARELAIKVDGLPPFTRAFRDLFLRDWEASAAPPASLAPVRLQAAAAVGAAADAAKPVPSFDSMRDGMAFRVYYEDSKEADGFRVAAVRQPGCIPDPVACRVGGRSCPPGKESDRKRHG